MAARSVLDKHGGDHELQLYSLERYIEQLPEEANFELKKWLGTLDLAQLKEMEKDALRCCCCKDLAQSREISAGDLIDIASMAYMADGCFNGKLEKSGNFAESLLIGLAVAACIERLRRAGWVVVTGRVEILLQDPPPYRVTQKGLEEGVWSDDPLTLWMIGSELVLH